MVIIIRKPPLVPNAAKTRGGFLIKSPKFPKMFGAFGADFKLPSIYIIGNTHPKPCF